MSQAKAAAVVHHLDREKARRSAAAIRAAIADPDTAGERSVCHVDYSRRRSAWLVTWSNIPELVLDAGRRAYTHVLLPGWEYTPRELRTEMLDDLDRLAETGEQPKVATR